MKKLYLILFLSLGLKVLSQTSVVQDAKGETALSLVGNSVVAINAKDESISFSVDDTLYINHKENHDIINFYGMTVKGKGKNGIFKMIGNNDFQFDGSFGFYIAKMKTSFDPSKMITMQNFSLSADLLFSQSKLYNQSLAFNDQVYTKRSYGYKISLGTNGQGDFKHKVPFIFGIFFNGGQKNNSNDLGSLEIEDWTLETDPDTGKTREVLRNKVSAYDADAYKNNLAYLNFNADFGIQIKNRFVFILHSRYAVMQDLKPKYNPGMGLYLTKDKAPLEVVCGLQLQALDLWNTADSNKSTSERMALNIVAGYNF